MRVKRIAKELEMEKQMAKTDDDLRRYDSGDVQKKRSWFLSEQDRKTVKEIVRKTSQGQLTEKEASKIMKEKHIRSAMLKELRGKKDQKEKAQKQRRPCIARDEIRKLKGQVHQMKRNGSYNRGVNLDARKNYVPED